MVLPVMMSGTVGQLGRSGIVGAGLFCEKAALSTTFNACLIACLSGEDCVGVRGEPCGVKVGDTASSSIQVAHSILCSRERDKVDSIVDKSSRLSPTRSGRWSVIVAIYVDRVGGQVHMVSKCLCRFGSV